MKFHFKPHFLRRVSIIVMLFLFFSSNKSKEIIREVDSPISLSTSDGAGLVLKSYESNTVLDGFFAFTEVKLSFYNPENRQREGRFRVTLPDNARLARFAMLIEDRWQEGEVVEREKATRVYEDFLHRKQDPAILETDAGNEFSARIFPIPAKSEKKIIFSYSQTLGGFPPTFTIPLLGLPRIDDFVLRVMYEQDEFQSKSANEIKESDSKLVTRSIFSIQKKEYKPDKNFTFEHKTKENLISKNGKLFALKVLPKLESNEKVSPLDNLVVLVDTSASSVIHFTETLEKLEKLIQGLKLKEAYIFGFDTRLTSYGKGIEGIHKLRDVEPLGSSNLSLSISQLKKIIEDKEFRFLLVSDVVLTAGVTNKKEIGEIFSKQNWIERLDVLIPTAYKDKPLIDTLVASGKTLGISASLNLDSKEIIRRLQSPVFHVPKVEVADSNWIHVDSSGSLQSGDSISVFGEMKSSDKNPADQIKINGIALKNIKEDVTEPLLLEREVTAARISRLLDLSEKQNDADIAKGHKLMAIQLSTSLRIQCPLTSFLVLETPEDYQRFQITRNALTDIMTIGLGGIEVLNRKTMLGYDFLNPENIEKWKLAEAQRIQNARKRKDNPKDDSYKDELKSFNGPNSKSESVSEKEESYEVSVSKPNTEDPVVPDESVEIKPNPKIKTETFPERNTYQVESKRPSRRTPIPSEKIEKIDPYTGKLKEFYVFLNSGENIKAMNFAKSWRKDSPDDLLALLALGDAYFSLGDRKNATRSYTSFVDYYPRRADIRRFAGEKLLSMGNYEDAIDTFLQALIERPDHPSTYHLLALAYIKTNKFKKAFDLLVTGLHQSFPTRYTNVSDIFYDDLDLLYTILKNTDKMKLIENETIFKKIKLKDLGSEIRFILVWETDANDVDFHIYDKDNHHAFYSSSKLESGGELYADITSGYGPECFRIVDPKAFPYRLEAHYYSRGPMGYGMGAMQVIRFDGEKKLDIETRSFVIMNDGAYLNLGKVK